MAERFYFKMWHSWWTGSSHIEAGADALAIGPCLMSFMRWTPGEDQAWAVQESGRPVTVAAIARRAKWTSARVAAALRDLEDKGTVNLRSDGAWGFPKFGKAQESASAAKMRRAREQNSSVTSKVTVTTSVTPLAELDAELEAEKQESLRDSPPSPPLGVGHESPANDMPGEESPGLLLATQAPSKPRASRKKPRAVVDEALVLAAYDAFRAARIELTNRGPQGLTDVMRDEFAKLVAACNPTLEDWCGAVRVRLRMDQRAAGYGSLTWASLTAPKNFERWVLESQKTGDQRAKQTGRAPVSSHPTESGVIDLKALMAAKERS